MKKFFKTIITLALLTVGIAFAYRASTPYLEKTFGTTNIWPYLNYKLQTIVEPNKAVQSDKDQSDSSTHTFSKPEANVYLDLTNPALKQASLTALSAWNNTGAFAFKVVDNKENAQIVIKAMDDSSTNAAGLTNTEYNSLTGHLLKATVQLNTHYLLNPEYNYKNDRIVNTVEHELGHAIGLNHRQDVSVMYPEGSFYTIQPIDVQNVKHIYKKQ